MLRRGDADAGKLLGLFVGLRLVAQHGQAVEDQRRGVVDPDLVGRLALDRRTPAKLGADQRLRTPSASASPSLAAWKLGASLGRRA